MFSNQRFKDETAFVMDITWFLNSNKYNTIHNYYLKKYIDFMNYKISDYMGV